MSADVNNPQVGDIFQDDEPDVLPEGSLLHAKGSSGCSILLKHDEGWYLIHVEEGGKRKMYHPSSGGWTQLTYVGNFIDVLVKVLTEEED